MRNKRVVAGILGFSFMMAVCAGCGKTQSVNSGKNTSDATSSYESSTESVKDAASSFDNILKTSDATFNYDGESYTVDQFSYYAYVDINQDGTDEMILSTTSDSFLEGDESALVLANVDGEAVPVFHVTSEAGAVFKLDKADSALTYFYRSSGEQHAEVYQLNGGELNKIKTLDHWEPYHYSDSDEDIYHIDEKDSSKDKFEEEWAQYYENAEEISYSSIN